MSNIENTAEETSARGGKGNPKLLSWDFNREATMQVQDAMLSPKSFELLSGNKVTSGKANIHMRQATQWDEVEGIMTNKGNLFPLKASGSGEISLAFTPNETASNILVYKADDDGGTPLSAGTLSGKLLTVATASNQEVVVYYTYEADNSETYMITSDSFPSVYKIVGKGIAA